MPQSVSLALSVRLLSSERSSAALHKLRNLSSAAHALSVQQLNERLASQSPFQAGVFAPYRAHELVQELAAAGFEVTLSAQNEG